MALRLIQSAMRFAITLFLLVLALSLGVPASYAALTNPGHSVADSDKECESRIRADCPFMCQPASALAQARQLIAAKPLPSCADGGVRCGKPAAISRETRSPVAAIGLGPPAYLIFRRLLL